MTEQTKAIFENPQLLREKLGEFFDTQNEKTIEKYAVVGEKMFEKGDKEKLKRYFDKKSTDFWVVLILGLTIISSLFLNLFGLEILNKISNVVFKVAFYIFLLMLLGHILILSYRGYMNGLLKMILGGCVVLFVFYSVLQFALTYGAFGLILGIGIVIFALLFALLSDLCFLFTKELVIENFAQSLDGAVKNAELGKIKKIFFGSSNEFGVGEGKSLFTVIIVVGIMPIIILFAAAMKDRRAGERILNQIEQVKTIISPKESKTQSEEEQKTQEKSQTQNQVLLNPIENAKKLLENNQKEKAIGILTKMCDENNGEACDFLAHIIDNEQASLRLYEKACNLGYYFSCSFASEIYAENKNYEMAIKLVQKGCDNNDYASCMELASTQEDQEKANEIYQKAAYLAHTECNNGSFDYCEMLGDMYQNGQNVTQDKKSAMKYYSKACDGQKATACVALGFMLKENGDLVNAKEYFGKACDIGGLGGDRGCELYKELNN